MLRGVELREGTAGMVRRVAVRERDGRDDRGATWGAAGNDTGAAWEAAGTTGAPFGRRRGQQRGAGGRGACDGRRGSFSATYRRDGAQG
jgi:hypothetical protein